MNAEENLPVVKPDWWCVAIDETEHWNIKDADKPMIERIIGVYFYDAREYTYCCELTPSHYLRFISHEVYVTDDTSDEDRERLWEEALGEGGEDFYMWVRDVQRITEVKRNAGITGSARLHLEKHESESEDEVREYLNGNNPFA